MINRWNDKAWLDVALQEARAQTLAVYAQLDEDAWQFPYKGTLNLPLWELGHIAYFQEHWCLRRAGRPSILAGADAFYDSANVGHAERWQLALPDKARTLDYLQEVLTLCLRALSAARSADLYFFQLVLLHEHMHREAAHMALSDLGYAGIPSGPDVGAGLAPMTWQHIAAGEYDVGAHPLMLAQQFVWDNEKWSQRVHLKNFAIAERLVTQAEYALFDAGFNVECAHAPVLGVSQAQASQYAAWCGARLPTEHEWTVAARAGVLTQEFGYGWQWTSSVFAPFSGFAPDPYREYSAPWFDGRHYVLKGSSSVTSPLLANLTYRNFYTPQRTDVFAGIRLAR
jgi:iron(II)-dependent oxidoreductase